MPTSHEDWVASLGAIEKKEARFTQAGGLRDAALGELREHIKGVMLPLLIRAFQPPSGKSETTPSLQDAHEQLKALDLDLKNLLRWCHQCRGHIQKALTLSFSHEMEHAVEQTPPTRSKMKQLLEGRLLRLRATLSCSESSEAVRAWWSKWIRK